MMLMNYWTVTSAQGWGEKSNMNLIKQEQWPKIAADLELTEREIEVVQLLFKQMTRDEISDHLGIKPRTVRQYMENIHSKLRVKTRIGVVLRVIQVRDSLGTK